MIKDDRGVGESFGQIRQLRDLRVIDPAFEAEPVILQMGIAAPEVAVQKQVLNYDRPARGSRRSASGGKFIGRSPGRTVPDTTEPLPARCQMSFDDGSCAI